jgi:hypothetical protein
MLSKRLRRLRTVPGVGSITALTWALEIGDFTRFRSVKQAISYCGLCGDESSSADKVMRMPLSKQRNKHIQRVLVEAAKLAPRECHELAVVRQRELEKRKSGSGHIGCGQEDGLLSVGRGAQEAGFRACRTVLSHRSSVSVLFRKEKISGLFRAQTARSRRLPTERRRSHSGGSLRIVSGLAANTNSIFYDSSSGLETANGCPVLHRAGTTSREARCVRKDSD